MLARVTPTVGIPLCVDAQGRWKPGRTYHYVDSAYARAIARAGGVAVYLPMQAEPAQLLERGDELRVTARADDGVVEAVERAGAGFCVGVQWHPESQDDPASDALFRAFIAAAGG